MGFLYVSRAIVNQLDLPFIDLHAASWTSDELTSSPRERRFEN
jgi:hypothetical protein